MKKTILMLSLLFGCLLVSAGNVKKSPSHKSYKGELEGKLFISQDFIVRDSSAIFFQFLPGNVVIFGSLNNNETNGVKLILTGEYSYKQNLLSIIFDDNKGSMKQTLYWVNSAKFKFLKADKKGFLYFSDYESVSDKIGDVYLKEAINKFLNYEIRSIYK